MTSLETFLSSPAVREKPFEIKFNGGVLSGLVRIHPAADYRNIVFKTPDEEFSEKIAEQLLNADPQRSLMFAPGTIEKTLPEGVIRMLSEVFVEANTGKKKED